MHILADLHVSHPREQETHKFVLSMNFLRAQLVQAAVSLQVSQLPSQG